MTALQLDVAMRLQGATGVAVWRNYAAAGTA
jgi:hypothetical protein